MGDGIKKGVEVEVMRGRERKKKGKVLRVLREKGLVLIEGLNIRKRHSRPTQKLKQGGIIEKEAPIHLSNIRLAVAAKK